MSNIFPAKLNLIIMKTTCMTLCLIITFTTSLPAQTDQIIQKPCRIWVTPMKHARNIEGYLYETRDSSVLVTTKSVRNGTHSGSNAAAEVWSKDIKQVDLKRTGTEGTAVLIGGIAGAVVGVIVGVLVGSSAGNTNDEQHFKSGAMIVFPILCTGIGAGIGGTAGGAKIVIPINGSQAELERNRYRLEGCSFIRQIHGDKVGAGTFSRLNDPLTDVDGNVYHLLALGAQVWMAENLRVTHFRNGLAIPGSSTRKLSNEIHYNWTDVADLQNICPAGWHVPTQIEWTSLCNSLGGEGNAAAMLDGYFTPKGWPAQWWSATGHPEENAGCFFVDGKSGRAFYDVKPKTLFMPVRCLRNN